jgi:hypothetical protein
MSFYTASECAGGSTKMILMSVQARQPQRDTWSIECIFHVHSIFLGLALDKSTL